MVDIVKASLVRAFNVLARGMSVKRDSTFGEFCIAECGFRNAEFFQERLAHLPRRAAAVSLLVRSRLLAFTRRLHARTALKPPLPAFAEMPIQSRHERTTPITILALDRSPAGRAACAVFRVARTGMLAARDCIPIGFVARAYPGVVRVVLTECRHPQRNTLSRIVYGYLSLGSERGAQVPLRCWQSGEMIP